jgi:hypothetical protein
VAENYPSTSNASADGSADIDDDVGAEPTVDEVIAKSQALLAELKQLQDEFDTLSVEEQAAMPESVRQFLGKSG